MISNYTAFVFALPPETKVRQCIIISGRSGDSSEMVRQGRENAGDIYINILEQRLEPVGLVRSTGEVVPRVPARSASRLAMLVLEGQRSLSSTNSPSEAGAGEYTIIKLLSATPGSGPLPFTGI